MAFDKNIYQKKINEPEMSRYREFDGYVYERRIVHSFKMADVGDPEIYVADPIHKWQESEQGQWIMKFGKDPQFRIILDFNYFGYTVVILAYVTPKKWTEYVLRGWFTG